MSYPGRRELMTLRLVLVLVLGLAMLAGIPAVAGLLASPALADDLDPAINRDADGRAAKGHDLVAYHEQRESIPGSPDFAVEWEGVLYLFATAENMRKFSADPEQYLPAYGGYCAYGVMMGEKVDIDPAQFHFEEGRLMFYFSGGTRSQWLRNRKDNLPLSDMAWERIRDLTPAEIGAGE